MEWIRLRNSFPYIITGEGSKIEESISSILGMPITREREYYPKWIRNALREGKSVIIFREEDNDHWIKYIGKIIEDAPAQFVGESWEKACPSEFCEEYGSFEEKWEERKVFRVKIHNFVVKIHNNYEEISGENWFRKQVKNWEILDYPFYEEHRLIGQKRADGSVRLKVEYYKRRYGFYGTDVEDMKKYFQFVGDDKLKMLVSPQEYNNIKWGKEELSFCGYDDVSTKEEAYELFPDLIDTEIIKEYEPPYEGGGDGYSKWYKGLW